MRDGIVVVDKPAGWTSQQAVARVKHRLAAAWGMRPKACKVGHAGTLDPMATGVLVVGVGRATKLLGVIAGHDKTYEATIRLGQGTATDDAEGESVGEPVDATPLSDAAIAEAVAALTGDIEQVPSSVSAIKVDGRRAYALVRAGENVVLKPRAVTVSSFDVLTRRDKTPYVDLDVRVECSTGTYVRALARDLGAALHVGGHVTALRRTRIGAFGLDQAVALDDVTEASLMSVPHRTPTGDARAAAVQQAVAGLRVAEPPCDVSGATTQRLALALGTFDGVHLGHRAVIAAARTAVGPAGTVTAVTFWPHPMTVFAPRSAPRLLQSLDAREDELLDAGADEVLVLDFTPEMAALTPQSFVESVLVPMAPQAVAVGPGFTFGARAAGTPQTLVDLARGRFDVFTAALVSVDGRPVSSTAIRSAVVAGDVALAARLLGREFSTRGPVVHGDHRGRGLGFPTANLAPDDTLVTPADGVYAGWLRLLDETGTGAVPLTGTDTMPAAVSVGDNPTFASARRVEAHIIGVDIDLYDRAVEVGFTRYLRGMIKFTHVDDLVAQMRRDVAEVGGETLPSLGGCGRDW